MKRQTVRARQYKQCRLPMALLFLTLSAATASLLLGGTALGKYHTLHTDTTQLTSSQAFYFGGNFLTEIWQGSATDAQALQAMAQTMHRDAKLQTGNAAKLLLCNYERDNSLLVAQTDIDYTLTLLYCYTDVQGNCIFLEGTDESVTQTGTLRCNKDGTPAQQEIEIPMRTKQQLQAALHGAAQQNALAQVTCEYVLICAETTAPYSKTMLGMVRFASFSNDNYYTWTDSGDGYAVLSVVSAQEAQILVDWSGTGLVADTGNAIMQSWAGTQGVLCVQPGEAYTLHFFGGAPQTPVTTWQAVENERIALGNLVQTQ